MAKEACFLVRIAEAYKLLIEMYITIRSQDGDPRTLPPLGSSILVSLLREHDKLALMGCPMVPSKSAAFQRLTVTR